ncbi:hypothetical protein LOK49_LG07G01745 [Camellia lanceoleosa]|uniref:Uncharacterized protein n=1 Tax=Camellia lanceoleosa TaxID=1840588 RepID=A0ACC0H1U1_9ERIC|nr:hypothetical protein LOK49_LG07G01745 [Camellia lanceoleosa]
MRVGRGEGVATQLGEGRGSCDGAEEVEGGSDWDGRRRGVLVTKVGERVADGGGGGWRQEVLVGGGFGQSPSVSLETVKGTSVTETTLRQLKRSFYTNLPPTYMKYTTNEVVPKIGLNFEEEKESYQVKIELNQVRHLVLDISCLDRDLDLRLMLCTKRIVTDLTDDEKCNIRSLINSAVLDPDVKGALRWPLGKESSGDQYTVVGIWHTNAKTFRSLSMRLKVRHADRFDFRTSAGEVTEEVSLKMTGILSQLREQSGQIDMVTEMLKDNIKLIWDCFLCFDC